MKTIILLAGTLSLTYGFDSQERETIRKTFPAAARIEVDNVDGRIHVTGYNGGEIRMVTEKTIRAESQDRLDAAKREVSLDTHQSGDTLTFYVDGPFRCHCGDGGHGIRDGGHRGYTVTYDFELEVPAATLLRLATINDGKIQIENTAGDFDLSSVNGAIEMREVAGSGQAHTVNGKISASFTKNPAKESSFKTVNGSIEATFQANLSADIRLKTFNGDAYTDFDSTALPRISPVADRKDGKFVYRADRSTGLRIGSGGPELSFDTLNGSIRIIERGQ
jgi:hypothetical protein